MNERKDPSGSTRTPAQAPLAAAGPVSQAMAQNLKAAVAPATDEELRARVALLEREAKSLGSAPEAAALYHEAGLLWEQGLKNPRNAAVAYQNAYRLAPRFLANIRAARRLFADVGNWQMVLQLLDAEIAATEEPRLQASLWFEKATLLEERLSRQEDAAAAYRACLELDPKDIALLVQLESRYSARADFVSLVKVYRALAETLEEPPLRAYYLTAAGMVLEHRLQAPDDAAQCFRAAFKLNRRDLVLLAAMKRHAERRQSADELVEVLAAEAELLGPEGAPAYLQLSKVFERMERPTDALAALLAARRATPRDPLILSELAAIYESQQRHQDLADVLLAWAESINDESEFAALNLRLAALYEELHREADAVARYEAILAKIPGNGAALSGLGKLYYRSGNWDGQLKVLEAEIAACEDPKEKATKVYKAAEVLALHLGREEDAILRYNHCLQILPGYLPAQKALTRLYEKQKRYGELAAMYEQDLTQTHDRDQQIATLNKIAALYEERLSDLDHAIDCYKRILELSADHLPTVRNLARVYEQAGRWQELIAVHEQEAGLVADTKQVISLYHRSAEIHDEQLKDRPGAIKAYERLLSLSPSYLPALTSLGRLYAQDGRWGDLIRMYRAEAEIAPNPSQAANLIHKIGELHETRLNNLNDAIASYQEVLTLAPSFFPALRALARIYRAQGAWENLIDVLRAEAANRTDPAERANALFQAAAIWEDQLSRPQLAIDGYQDVLRLSPGHPAALRALERLYTTEDELKELIAVLDRQTQTAPTTAEKASTYIKLARLYLDRLSEPAKAAQCCDAALAADPSNMIALLTLERIRASDRTRRTELKLRLSESLPEGKLRQALRISAALDLDAPATTARLEALQKGFAHDPKDARIAFALERVLRQAGDDAGLAAFYEQAMAGATDVLERREIAMRIAELCETRLQDPRRALFFYRMAAEASPRFVSALQGIRRVSLAVGNVAAARTAWEAEASMTTDVRASVDAFVQAARLCEQLGELDAAATNYRSALERDPLDAAASAALESLLAKKGGAEDLALLHESRAGAKLGQQQAGPAADELVAAARAWMDAGDRRRALSVLDRALAAAPNHSDALELKGQECLKDERWPDAAAAFAARVQQGGPAPTLAPLHLTLGKLYQDHLSDLSRAAAHLQTAIAAEPANREALERLAKIHLGARNWTGAVDCLKQLLELEREPAALARHHLALGEAYEAGFGDVVQAAAQLRRALELTPEDDRIVERLVPMYERAGNMAELVHVLEEEAARAKDPSRQVYLQLKLGELSLRVMGEPGRAIEHYRTVTALDPTCLPAHLALAELYAKDGTAVPAAIEAHRTVLRLDASRLESLHGLFRLYEGQGQQDRAFCAAGLLQFAGVANELESAFHTEHKGRLANDLGRPLTELELDRLSHPGARHPAAAVLRAIGDQLGKLYPPQFEAVGVDRKADRLKPEHPVHKALRSMATALGVEELDVYQSKRGLIQLETGEPLAVCVSNEVVRKFNLREQRFLVARALMGLRNKTAVVGKLTRAELGTLILSAVRIVEPGCGSAPRNEELTRQLKKALSRKALKALEEPAKAVAAGGELNADDLALGLEATANRMGLLFCGDPLAALSVLLRQEAYAGGPTRIEANANPLDAVQARRDLKMLFEYAISDEFFRLRDHLGLGLVLKASPPPAARPG